MKAHYSFFGYGPKELLSQKTRQNSRVKPSMLCTTSIIMSITELSTRDRSDDHRRL